MTIVKRLIEVRREQILKQCADMLPIMLFADVQASAANNGAYGITPKCELHLMEALFTDSMDPVSLVERLCPIADDRAYDFSPAL